jgi:uncharacterized membrane protein YhaH (DUF805 family)
MGLFSNVKDGDEFIAVSDGTGGFNLKPKNSGNNELGGCLIILLVIGLVLVVSLILLPAGLAIYAFSKDDDSARKIRIYVVLIFAVLALIQIFASDLLVTQQIHDLYMSYEIFFGIILLLNFVGLASAVIALFGLSDQINKVITQYSMIGIIAFSIYQHGWKIIEYTPPDISSRRAFSKEKIDIACDCYRVSFEYTQKIYDDLTRQSDKDLRSRCYDLFREDPNQATEIVDALMKRACELKNSN